VGRGGAQRGMTQREQDRDRKWGAEEGWRGISLDSPADFFKITNGLIIFSADIRISRIYADNRKFG